MTTIDFSQFPRLCNKAYYQYLNDYRRYQIFKGGGSAGKSVFLSDRDVYRMVTLPQYNNMVVRQVAATNRHSTFAEMLKSITKMGFTIGRNEDFSKIESKGAEEITCNFTGNKTVFKGLDDVSKVLSFTFPRGDVDAIRVEEATETKKPDVIQLGIRLRGLGRIPKSLTLSFNPIDEDHWIKEHFFDNPMSADRGFICETTYKDNRFLAPADREELENLKNVDLYHYNVYCLGHWGNIEGTKFLQNLQIHDFDIPEDNYKNIRHGLDFGFKDAQVLVGTGWIERDLYIFKEFYHNEMQNIDFIRTVQNSGTFDPIYPIAADNNRPGLIAEWENEGFTIYGAKKGPGSKVLGKDFIKRIPKIHIHETNCPNTAREFKHLKYRQLRDGRILDEVLDLNDHSFDAVKYANEEFFIDGQQTGKSGAFMPGCY